MRTLINLPFLVFVVSLLGLWFSAYLGALLGQKQRPSKEEERKASGIVEVAIFTLLGLVIAFTFSMAVSSYDQRKNYEEAEANAIRREYLRADLLPAPDATRVHELLRNYLTQRILFFNVRDLAQLRRIDESTAQLQNELWSTVQARSVGLPTPVVGLVVSGMEDVLNSQRYTRFAQWDCIPITVWGLMAAIAVSCNLLVGYGARRMRTPFFLSLPLALSITFFLIADMDSPGRGLIRVPPQDLVSLSHSLQAH
jgi:MFS family permease